MKHFPNTRPGRLAGLEDCLEHMHRRPPTWRLFGRILAMLLVSFVVGLLLAFVLYHATGALS